MLNDLILVFVIVALNEPVLVITLLELLKVTIEIFDVLELQDPEKTLLQSEEKALNAAIAF